MDSRRPVRVLIVEDDRVSRKALATLLTSSGYRVESAESAERALALLRKSGDDPDVILVDVDLPGMSGIELLQYIRQFAPQAVPVLVTALERERVMAAAGRAVDYLRKPINFNHLLHVLDRSVLHA
jgi:CheY-like chemotaxis protein